MIPAGKEGHSGGRGTEWNRDPRLRHGANPPGTRLARKSPLAGIIPIPSEGYSSPSPWFLNITNNSRVPSSRATNLDLNSRLNTGSGRPPDRAGTLTFEERVALNREINARRAKVLDRQLQERTAARTSSSTNDKGTHIRADVLNIEGKKVSETFFRNTGRDVVVYTRSRSPRQKPLRLSQAGRQIFAAGMVAVSATACGAGIGEQKNPNANDFYDYVPPAGEVLKGVIALERYVPPAMKTTAAEKIDNAVIRMKPNSIDASASSSPTRAAAVLVQPSPTIQVANTVSGAEREVRTGATPTPIQQLDNLKLISQKGVDEFKKTLPDASTRTYNQFELTFKSADNKFVLDLSYILTTATEGLSAQDIGSGQQLLGGVENADLYFWSDYGQARAFRIERPDASIGNVKQVIFDQFNNRMIYVVERNGELKRYLSSLQGSNAGKLVVEAAIATSTPSPTAMEIPGGSITNENGLHVVPNHDLSSASLTILRNGDPVKIDNKKEVYRVGKEVWVPVILPDGRSGWVQAVYKDGSALIKLNASAQKLVDAAKIVEPIPTERSRPTATAAPAYPDLSRLSPIYSAEPQGVVGYTDTSRGRQPNAQFDLITPADGSSPYFKFIVRGPTSDPDGMTQRLYPELYFSPRTGDYFVSKVIVNVSGLNPSVGLSYRNSPNGPWLSVLSLFDKAYPQWHPSAMVYIDHIGFYPGGKPRYQLRTLTFDPDPSKKGYDFFTEQNAPDYIMGEDAEVKVIIDVKARWMYTLQNGVLVNSGPYKSDGQFAGGHPGFYAVSVTQGEMTNKAYSNSVY